MIFCIIKYDCLFMMMVLLLVGFLIVSKIINIVKINSVVNEDLF